MRYELNGRRLLMGWNGDVWEVEENDKNDWHLIRHGISVSMPKLGEETFAQLVYRLSINFV